MSTVNPERSRIAIVDDDDIYREFISALLRADGRFVVFDAADGEALCGILDRQAIDCVVLDYHVGDESGFSIKRRLQDRFAVVPPIVMLTGDDSQSTVISALRLGISDWVPKRDMETEGLFAAIERAISRDRETREAVAERLRLLALATRDGLTGLANRRAFDEALASEYRRARRDKTPLGLILIDVDRFKAFNDRQGHPAGDTCLIRVGDVIQAALCRAGDTAARWGGEEFAVILPNTSEAGCAVIAERIRRTLFDLALPHSAGVDGVVTISAGAAATEPEVSDGDPRALVQLADRALYAAKHQGRNTIVRASDLPARDGAAA